MSNTTAIATINEFRFPMAMPDAETFDPAEYEDIAPEFPRVKIPAGGAIAFELPNPDDPDDPLTSKTLEGVIVYQHNANAYWENSESSGTPPDCSSTDGHAGYGNPGGACTGCHLNQFGSGEGGIGKACKNMRNLYLLRDGDMLPLMISLPPTSLKAFQVYANNLRFAGRALSGVKTQISLKKQEGNGNTFSVAVFKMTGTLAPEIAELGRKYAAEMRASIKGSRSEAAAQGDVQGVSESVPPENMNPATGEVPY